MELDGKRNEGELEKSLCKIISLADSSSLKRLCKAFPEEVDSYIASIHNEVFEDWIKGLE